MPSLPPHEPSDEDKEMLRRAQEQYERILRQQQDIVIKRRNAIQYDLAAVPERGEFRVQSDTNMLVREDVNGDRESSTDGGRTWIRLADQRRMFIRPDSLQPPSMSATQPKPALSRHVTRLAPDGTVWESGDGGDTFQQADLNVWREKGYQTSTADDERHEAVWRLLNHAQQRLSRKARGYIQDRISVGKLPETGIRRQTQLLMEDVVWAADELVEHLETQKPANWSPLDWLTRRGQRIGKVVETINTLRRFAASLEEPDHE